MSTGRPSDDKPVRVSDRVAAAVMEQIAAGTLSPGQRLPGERQLAESMGVSRVSVRAALQRLKARGYLTAVQGGGTRVVSGVGDLDAPLTDLLRANLGNLRDLAEIRLDLEAWAARRAALNASERDVADLGRAIDLMRRAKGRAKVEADVNFHVILARATKSPVFAHLYEVVRDTLKSSLEHHKYRLFVETDDGERLVAQHRAVYEAIRDRNPEAAGRAMAEHLRWVLDRYEMERSRHAEPDPV